MAEGKKQEAEARINQLFELVLSMARKGFLDGDTALMRNNNIGYVADRAVYIDTGHITRRQSVNLKERMQFEFDIRLAPLHDWLKMRFPELAEYYVKRQQEIMDSLPEGTIRADNKLNSPEALAKEAKAKAKKAKAVTEAPKAA